MRKLIVQTEMSLDGVLDSPQLWGSIFDYHDEGVRAYLDERVLTAGALVMGRLTYEGFAEVWPSRAGEETADKINSMPKYVASRTLHAPLTWNCTLIEGDAAAAVAKLKQEPGEDIVQYGIGELTHTLLAHNLVDEMRFLIFPFAVGNGRHIFENVDPVKLKLITTKSFASGAVVHHYAPQTRKLTPNSANRVCPRNLAKFHHEEERWPCHAGPRGSQSRYHRQRGETPILPGQAG